MNYQLMRKGSFGLKDMAAITLALIISFTQTIYTQTILDSEKSKAITKELLELVSDEKAPGMIAAIISSEGIVAIGSAGVRKAGSDIAITNNDLVHLGSCTKAMTSTMIATLIEDGKLRWDMKLIEAIPELKKSIHTDYHNITIWQLLTHRAGIPANTVDWDAHKQKEMKERRLTILKDNLSTPSPIIIGEFTYSNFGYVIAACMAEKITGTSWEVLMKKRLFDPLGMTTAGFGEPDKQNKIDQPWGHSKWSGKWEPSRSYDPEAIGPAGEIHCTVEDWAKYISLFLTEKNQILDRKYLNKLVEPVGFYAGGWGVSNQTWANGKIFTHDGSNGIWFATVIIAPWLDRAFIVVTNSLDFSSTSDVCSKMKTKLILIDSGALNN